MKVELTQVYDRYYEISVDRAIPSWDFLLEYKHVTEVYRSTKFYTQINTSIFIDIKDFERFLDSKLNDKVYIPQTIQELNSILRRLEREVNPSFKQHTKTLLGIL